MDRPTVNRTEKIHNEIIKIKIIKIQKSWLSKGVICRKLPIKYSV
jgi:hypothetical protein